MKANKCDLIIKNASVYLWNKGLPKFEVHDLCLDKGKIVHIGPSSTWAADQVKDYKGLSIFPGFIDSQVHFREPGLEHKDDLQSGSRAAVKGGVTSVFEMPNTKPATSNREAVLDKLSRAKDRMWTNYAFYVGATLNNIDSLKELEKIPGCCGTKIFMGSSTGDLLVDQLDGLEKILSQLKRNVAVHSEDEARLVERSHFRVKDKPISHIDWRDEITALRSTQNLIKIAEKVNKKVHVLHITTKQEVEFLADYPSIASLEVTPQHLSFSAPEIYDEIGTLAQMNPPIRTEEHRLALWKGLNENKFQIIGSDHAPHTLEEKQKNYPATPSGMPGVQTTVPVMLTHVKNGHLSLQKLIELMVVNPVNLFKIKNKGFIDIGLDADLSVIDLKKEWTIDKTWIEYKCGWSPFDGFKATGLPIATVVQGQIAFSEGQFAGAPKGQKIDFSDL